MKKLSSWPKDTGQISQTSKSVIKLDGCSAIATSNLKKVKNITACYFETDRIGVVGILSLVAVSPVDSNLRKDV